MHIFILRAPDRHRRTIKKLRLDYPGVFKKYQNSLLRFAKSSGIAAKANIADINDGSGTFVKETFMEVFPNTAFHLIPS